MELLLVVLLAVPGLCYDYPVKCLPQGENITMEHAKLSFKYPRHDGNYMDHERCNWIIQHKSGLRLAGVLSVIDLERNDGGCYDYAKLNDILTCHRPIKVESNILTVSFFSDGSNTRSGFKVDVKVRPVQISLRPESYFLLEGRRLLPQGLISLEPGMLEEIENGTATVVNLGSAIGKPFYIYKNDTEVTLSPEVTKPNCSMSQVACGWRPDGKPEAEKVYEERYLSPYSAYTIFTLIKYTNDSWTKLAEISKHPLCNYGWPFGDGCFCHIGFSGKFCSTGCGPNKFGSNCEATCSTSRSRCQGIVFSTFKGLSCATGFMGETCETPCPLSRFGSNCKEECGHCYNTEGCNSYTGVCHSGCQLGFIPPYCQEKVVHYTGTLQFSEVKFTSIRITATLNKESLSGFGSPKWAKFFHRASSSSNWESSELYPVNNEVISIQLENLSFGTRYWIKLLLYNEQLVSYDQLDNASSFTTPCIHSKLDLLPTIGNDGSLTLTWQEEPMENSCTQNTYTVGIWKNYKWVVANTTDSWMKFDDLIPDHRYIFKVKKTFSNNSSPSYYTSVRTPKDINIINQVMTKFETPNSISLSWNYEGDDKPEKFIITYQCTMLGARGEESCEEDEGSLEVTGELEARVEGLSPFRRYRLSISTLGGSSTVTYAATQPSVASITPALVKCEPDETSVYVEWALPGNYSNMNGVFRAYKYEIQDKEGNTLLGNSTQQLNVNFTDLHPDTNYTLLVWIVNSEGINQTASLSVPFRTQSSKPEEVKDLVAYKKGRGIVGLRWKSGEINGELSHFLIETDLLPPIEVTPSPCNPWPHFYCHTIKLPSLEPDVNFTVSAVNSKTKGLGKLITVNTKELAPEAPINLQVENISNNTVQVTWEPPFFFNGILRSFLIKLEQTDSMEPNQCCGSLPKVEVIVEEELPFYNTEITGLSSGSSFALSLMAETVWLGPPVQRSFSTRPPQPSPPPLPSVLLPPPFPLPLWPPGDQPALTSRNNLLLVVPLSAENESDFSDAERDVIDPDLHQVLLKEINQAFYVATEYSEEEEIELEGDGPTEKFKLVAASVANYSGLHTVNTINSQIFEAPTPLKIKSP